MRRTTRSWPTQGETMLVYERRLIKTETLSLSLRLRVAPTAYWLYCSVFCSVAVDLCSVLCSVICSVVSGGNCISGCSSRWFMDANCKDVLDNVPERVRGRSHLDPYGDLIDELRRLGRTYR